MKKLILLLIISGIIFPKQVKAQDEGVLAAAAVAIGVGVAALSIENLKEQVELSATQWFLSNNNDIDNFQLKTMDLNGKKLKDMSSVSVISFFIQGFDPSKLPKKKSKPRSSIKASNNFNQNKQQSLKLDGKKYVLLAFTSSGWMSDYGVNLDLITWQLIDKNEWEEMMVTYVKAASGNFDDNLILNSIREGKVVNDAVKVDNKKLISFYDLRGDMYVTKDYNEDIKFVYNENSLGIYLKQTKDLVQMRRNSIIEINNFFFEN